MVVEFPRGRKMAIDLQDADRRLIVDALRQKEWHARQSLIRQVQRLSTGILADAFDEKAKRTLAYMKHVADVRKLFGDDEPVRCSGRPPA